MLQKWLHKIVLMNPYHNILFQLRKLLVSQDIVEKKLIVALYSGRPKEIVMGKEKHSMEQRIKSRSQLNKECKVLIIQ